MTTRQRADLDTAVGTYEFHQIDPDLFDGFGPYRRTGNFDIATPEKALFDTMYLSARKGRRFLHLPELELTEDFFSSAVSEWIVRVSYDRQRSALENRWAELVERHGLKFGGR